MTMFKESYLKLFEEPILWLHYALGTILLILFFVIYNAFALSHPIIIYVDTPSFVSAFNTLLLTVKPFTLITFYIYYIFIDRFIHGLLELI